jgi:hypothetical protein
MAESGGQKELSLAWWGVASTFSSRLIPSAERLVEVYVSVLGLGWARVGRLSVLAKRRITSWQAGNKAEGAQQLNSSTLPAG